MGIRNLSTIPKWYIGNHEGENGWLDYIVVPLRFLLLNSSMIPISLKVTLEVCKVIYSMFINMDEQLYAVRRRSDVVKGWMPMLWSTMRRTFTATPAASARI